MAKSGTRPKSHKYRGYAMTGPELLVLWERVHFELTTELRAQFLAHPAVSALIAFPEARVREALKMTPRLDDALQWLRRGSTPPGTPAPSQNATNRTMQPPMVSPADLRARAAAERESATKLLRLYPDDSVHEFAAITDPREKLARVRAAFHPVVGFADWNRQVMTLEARELELISRVGRTCSVAGCRQPRPFGYEECRSAECPRRLRQSGTDWSQATGYDPMRDH